VTVRQKKKEKAGSKNARAQHDIKKERGRKNTEADERARPNRTNHLMQKNGKKSRKQ